MEYQIKNISRANFEQCIKCTICTVYCPVLAVYPDYPGPKQAGPDGERYRLKNEAFYDSALKYCLNCKRCEVACPSGVKIGDIIQGARLRYDRSPILLRDRLLASTDFVGSVSTLAAPLVNFMLRRRIVRRGLQSVLSIDHRRRMPVYARRTFESLFRKVEADQMKYTKHVWLFHGCDVNYNEPELGMALIRVLNAAGYGVRLLRGERCCGVAKIANRLISEARADARHNIDIIRKAIAEEDAPVLFLGATCALTVRDEYEQLLGLDTSDIRGHIILASVWLARMMQTGRIQFSFDPNYARRVTYHTACHIEKLGWAHYPAWLLAHIPGVDFVAVDSQCCGMAGTYGFKKECYDISMAIGGELFDKLRSIAPDVVATDCETCRWQLQSAGFTAVHPIAILAEALTPNPSPLTPHP